MKRRTGKPFLKKRIPLLFQKTLESARKNVRREILMKTMLDVLLGLILCGTSFAASLEIKKDVIPFPGGDPKIRYHYFEQDGKKILHGSDKNVPSA